MPDTYLDRLEASLQAETDYAGELLEECEGLRRRVGELEAALRALVALGPIFRVDSYLEWWCVYCDGADGKDAPQSIDFRHAKDCPWAKARTLLAGKGEG